MYTWSWALTGAIHSKQLLSSLGGSGMSLCWGKVDFCYCNLIIYYGLVKGWEGVPFAYFSWILAVFYYGSGCGSLWLIFPATKIRLDGAGCVWQPLIGVSSDKDMATFVQVMVLSRQHGIAAYVRGHRGKVGVPAGWFVEVCDCLHFEVRALGKSRSFYTFQMRGSGFSVSNSAIAAVQIFH